jgi:two-component system, NarL family, invasion response regulator UvrY
MLWLCVIRKMRILIVDHHSVVRSGLRQILAEEMPAATFAEAEDNEQALACIQSKTWNLVVLEVDMPVQTGLELLERIKQLQPQTPVLVFTVYPEDQLGVACLKAGAHGYLVKSALPEEVVSAVKKVLAQGRYLSPELAERVAVQFQFPNVDLPHSELSKREYEVMLMIAKGKALKEIADALEVSPKTVSTYRKRILEKIHVKSNAALTRYALSKHLIH